MTSPPQTPSKVISVRPSSPTRQRIFTPTKAPKYDLTPDNHIPFHKYRKRTGDQLAMNDVESNELHKQILDGLDIVESLQILARDTSPQHFKGVEQTPPRNKAADAITWDTIINAVPKTRVTLSERFSPR